MLNDRKSLVESLDTFLYSIWYPLCLIIVATIFYVLKSEFIGVLLLAGILCFVLIVHKDTMPTLLPFLLICAMPLRMDGRAEEWLALAPAVIVAIPSLFFHFIYYNPKWKLGKMFYPYLAIAIAITLGGVFSIKAKDYFHLMNLYYVLGLGFGMLLSYVLLNAHIGTATKSYDVKDYLAKTMMWLAVFILMMIVVFYVESKDVIKENYKVLYLQMGNNLSTNLLITMPFAFYLSKKCKFHTLMFSFGILQYLAILASLSRGGIIFGTIMIAFCLPYGIIINDKKTRKYLLALVCCFLIAILVLLIPNADVIKEMLEVKKGEARTNLFKYAIECFKNYPIFGTGLGHQGEFFNPQPGSMYWYHSTPFQVMASLGIVGVCAYAYQFFSRMMLLKRNISPFTGCVFLSFLGYQLMSLVNPAEFCPLPYVLVIVLLFVIVEKEEEKLPREIKKLK